VGSIGLVASVPITTGLAALVVSREPAPHDATPRPARAARQAPRRRPVWQDFGPEWQDFGPPDA
jgi:hypothetical protein